MPVSLNLSQLDFECCDIIGHLERFTEEFDIPRVYIHAEITESLLAADADATKERMDRLQNDGFEVWMDDFGSEYSSLNTLKDFDFHTLKIDLKFLTSFSDKSRRIISSIIRMAKEIGVHTLAEGVETFEHYSFLREAGCEKIQGYFFGKPAPYEESIKNIRGQGISVEDRVNFMLWNKIGRLNLQTDLPLAIVHDDGQSMNPVFSNARHKEELASLGFSCSDTMQDFFNENSLTASQIRHFLRSLPKSGQSRTVLLQEVGDYVQVCANLVAENQYAHIYAVNVTNISKDEKRPGKQVDSLESLLRYSYQLYQHIILIDPARGNVTTVYGYIPGADIATNSDDSSADDGAGTGQSRIVRYFSRMSENLIFPDDRDRFNAYISPDTMARYLAENPGQSFNDYFRIRMEDGNYQWMKTSTIGIDDDGPRKYLVFGRLTSQQVMQGVHEQFSAVFGERPSAEKSSSGYFKAAGSSEAITPESLWFSLLQSSSMKLFWKDRERRFVGASRAFLRFYGFQSIDEIRGKTDEDVGWHVDQKPYHSDEVKVLTEGQLILNSPGKCIVHGQLHNIMATKFPIYSGGQIVGLVGWFTDLNQESGKEEDVRTAGSIDPVTGLLNPLSMVLATRTYVENYDLSQADFAVIRFRLHGYKRLGRDLGSERLNQIMKEVGRQLREKCGNSAIIANYGAGDLLALFQTSSRNAVERYADHIREIIEGVRSVSGISVTFYVKYDYVWYHEARNVLEFQKMVDGLKVK